MPVSRWLRAVGLWAFITLGPACSGTPLPEPPDLQPPAPDLVVVEVEPGFADDLFTFEGAPGAVASDAQIWATVLDRDDPPMLVAAQPDGSFSVTLMGAAGEVARLQARREGTRSPPLDLLLQETNAPAMPAPTDPCLVLEPPFEVVLAPPDAGEASSEGTLVVQNGCGGEVRIESLRLRRGDAAFDVVTDAPVAVPDGSTAEVRLRFAPSEPTGAEDLVLLEATLPSGSERRAVFVLGEGP